MSDLRFNSIAGAVLASVLGVMGLGVAADAVFHPNYPAKAGYAPVVEATTGGGGPAAEGPTDFGALLGDPAQLADMIARGERGTAACHSCHNFDPGGPNGTGPNLHDVFGRPVASHAGFSYSDGMHAHGGNWDWEALDHFLKSPGQVVRGTKMAFAGIRRTEDRVAVIAYLRSISPNQLPIPAPLPQAAPAEAAAAPDAAAGGTVPAGGPQPTPAEAPHT
jgi:cytochrome c